MAKKEIRIEDVKSEDIQKEIDKAFYGKEEENNHHFFSKIFTFLLLFCFYIVISIKIKDYAPRIIFIFFGLIALLVLFQTYVFRKKTFRRV